MYIRLQLEDVVLRANEIFPGVMVTGPRQVGKTTLLEHLAEEGRSVVCLDSRMNREMAISEPELFLQRYPSPVLIDEFQSIPSRSKNTRLRIATLRGILRHYVKRIRKSSLAA